MSPKPTEHHAGIPCDKERGHKSRWHSAKAANKRWEGGIRTPAKWEVKDDGYMSEADYDIQRRYGI